MMANLYQGIARCSGVICLPQMIIGMMYRKLRKRGELARAAGAARAGATASHLAGT